MITAVKWPLIGEYSKVEFDLLGVLFEEAAARNPDIISKSRFSISFAYFNLYGAQKFVELATNSNIVDYINNFYFLFGVKGRNVTEQTCFVTLMKTLKITNLQIYHYEQALSFQGFTDEMNLKYVKRLKLQFSNSNEKNNKYIQSFSKLVNLQKISCLFDQFTFDVSNCPQLKEVQLECTKQEDSVTNLL